MKFNHCKHLLAVLGISLLGQLGSTAHAQDDFTGTGTFPYSDLTADEVVENAGDTGYQGPRLLDMGPVKDAMSTNPVNDLPKPNKPQYEFMKMDMGLFIHFGMNTFSGQGTGGTGRFSPEIFNPTELDCDNWMEVAKAMGAEYVVLTARHEEGFCLWPTETTDYSIRNSPYKSGQGDIVREFVDACRRHGLKPALYIPPYMDAYNIFQPEDDITWYRNWYEATNKRLSEPGAAERFTQMQLQQIRELLTHYGPITYLWMDHIGETMSVLNVDAVEKFWVRVVEEVRRLQPETLILQQDVGLAAGQGGAHGGRSFYPVWYKSKRVNNNISQGWPIHSREDGHLFLVWESNVIFSGGWFWNGPEVKSVEEMKEHYLQTVGRGAMFLPNFAPDKRGLMTDTIKERAQALGQFVRRFDSSIAETKGTGTEYEMELPGSEPVQYILMQEELREGQKVLAYTVEAKQDDGSWAKIAEGQSIGRKRIQEIEPLKTKALRLRITDTAAEGVQINRFAAIQ